MTEESKMEELPFYQYVKEDAEMALFGAKQKLEKALELTKRPAGRPRALIIFWMTFSR